MIENRGKNSSKSANENFGKIFRGRKKGKSVQRIADSVQEKPNLGENVKMGKAKIE